jgi:UDP-N-acetylmuramoylalanine--D-glutamate ligase
MKIPDLNKQNIACLGLGSENYAMLEYIMKHGFKKPLTIFEFKKRSEFEKRYPQLKNWKHISWQTGKQDFKNLKKFSLLFRSPGVFLSESTREQLKKSGTVISSPMQLFFDLCPTKNIIGVTGTKGKGTTASLICAILKAAKKDVYLGGNIGLAPFLFMDKIKKNSWIILELSSFQLQDIHSSPQIAVITNFSPEHLQPADPNNPNFHPNLKHYWNSKWNISKFQKRIDILVANKKLAAKLKQSKAKILYFQSTKLQTSLRGEHNKENIAAAEMVARQLKIKPTLVSKVIKNFSGLEHRLEKVTVANGVSYYNDSFATIPASTITAIKSFNEPIILLAGGADKASDFSQLAKLIKQRIKFLILFKGKGTDRLLKALSKIKYDKKNTVIVNSMPKAINVARKHAVHDDIILLSPACASFGVFQNYKDRGKQFVFYAQK